MARSSVRVRTGLRRRRWVVGSPDGGEWGFGTVRVTASGVESLFTDVHPAFPTDAAPLMGAALLRARGETAITDTIFENRFSCAEGFSALGGSVNVSGRTLYVHGVPALRAARLCAPDLRGGAALVLAALQAEGESFLTATGHIMRGYEDLPALFGALGAKIVPVRDWDENL